MRSTYVAAILLMVACKSSSEPSGSAGSAAPASKPTAAPLADAAPLPGDDVLAAAGRIATAASQVMVEFGSSCGDGTPAVDRALASMKRDVDLVATGRTDPAVAARLANAFADESSRAGKAYARALRGAQSCGDSIHHYKQALGLETPPPPAPGDAEVAAATRIVTTVGPVVVDTRDSCVNGPPEVDKAIAKAQADVDLVTKGWSDPAIAARLHALLDSDSSPTGKLYASSAGAAIHCGKISQAYRRALGLDQRAAR